MKKFDCIVAGAGISGFAAALGARRAGATVLLVDRLPLVGGSVVYALTAFLSGWPFPRRAGGIADELIEALERRNALVWRGNNASVDEDIIQQIMMQMLTDAGVEMLFNADIVGAETCRRQVKSISVQCCGKLLNFAADAFVDATGDASLSVLSGAETVTPEVELSMTKTLMFKVRNIKNFDKIAVAERFQEVIKEYPFPVAIQNKFMGTPLTRDDEMVLNLTAVAGDAADPLQYNAMHRELLLQIPLIVEYLQKHFSEFAECYVSKIAPLMGVRYTRSIAGWRTLTLEDMANPEPPEDAVALCGNYFGGHYIKNFASPWGSRITGNPAIPYGALRSKSFDNLLAAGRIIAADPLVISAVRLNVTCIASGQAAGIAAALKIPECSVLRAELTRQNCIYQK